MQNTSAKQAYEWVLNMSDKDTFVLTENQYNHYKNNWKEGKMFFDTFEINPSFVVSARKFPASEELKKKYPCPTCHTNGNLNEYDEKGVLKVCPTCEGTGMGL